MTMAVTMVGFAIAILALLPSLTLPTSSNDIAINSREVLALLILISIFIFSISALFYNRAAAVKSKETEAEHFIKRGNNLFLVGLFSFLLEPIVLCYVLNYWLTASFGLVSWIIFLAYVTYIKIC